MIPPQKKIREVLYSLHKLSYRIKLKPLDKKSMNEKLFISVIDNLKRIEERRDFMQEEIGLDMTVYEEQFFDVIEDLIRMHFSKEQQALIQMYLYQLIPDKEWDGTITVEVGKKKEEKVVKFKTAKDVWDVIKTFDNG